MVEPQLLDYIKKARQAGQSDDQTKALLYKNGWEESEVREAFSSIDLGVSQPQPEIKTSPEPTQPDIKTDLKTEYQPTQQPKISVQKDVQKPQYQPQQQTQPQPSQSKYETQPRAQFQTKIQREGNISGLLLKILIIIIILAVLGFGGYLAITKQEQIKNLYQNLLHKPEVVVPETTTNNGIEKQTPTPQPAELFTQTIASVPENYDATRITAVSFSDDGKTSIYCVPLKINVTKFTCFANTQILMENPYSFKPYWSGISPDNQRIIFLYYDPVKKQSFTLENGKEGLKYDGTITYPAFSNDSQNFAYMVMANDGRNFVVINDRPGLVYAKVFTVPEFTQDSRYVLYGAISGKEIYWVADKIEPKIIETGNNQEQDLEQIEIQPEQTTGQFNDQMFLVEDEEIE
jgi:hypothetical protein